MKSHQIVIKRVFKLAKRELFDAWSKPEIMCRWFFASPQTSAACSVQNSFVKHGEYKLVMHMEDYDVNIYGQYLEINRYNLIVFSWNSSVVSDSRVSLAFKSLSQNRTELILTHRLLPDQTISDQHIVGWNYCFDNLEKIIEQMWTSVPEE